MWQSDECQVDGIRLEGFAAGGEATSIRAPGWGLIFDIGICVPKCIAHRYHSLLISHGHSDHAAALVYMLGQRSMRKLPVMDVYLPAEILEPVQRLLEVWKDIEGYDRAANFIAVNPGERHTLASGQEFMALRTVHRVPSLAYLLGAPKTSKLQIGPQAPFEPYLCVTGDTTIDFLKNNPLAQRARVMVHEVTAWDQTRSVQITRERGHTHVDELIEAPQLFEQHEALVLVHRSSRHSRRFAQEVVDTQFPEAMANKTVIFG